MEAECRSTTVCRLKRETSPTNAWLSQQLSMGVPNEVSDYRGKCQRNNAVEGPTVKNLKTER